MPPYAIIVRRMAEWGVSKVKACSGLDGVIKQTTAITQKVDLTTGHLVKLTTRHLNCTQSLGNTTPIPRDCLLGEKAAYKYQRNSAEVTIRPAGIISNSYIHHFLLSSVLIFFSYCTRWVTKNVNISSCCFNRKHPPTVHLVGVFTFCNDAFYVRRSIMKLAILCLSLASTACAAPVSVKYQPNVHFTKLKPACRHKGLTSAYGLVSVLASLHWSQATGAATFTGNDAYCVLFSSCANVTTCDTGIKYCKNIRKTLLWTHVLKIYVRSGEQSLRRWFSARWTSWRLQCGTGKWDSSLLLRFIHDYKSVPLFMKFDSWQS